MSNLAHSIESVPSATIPSERSRGLGRVFELLLIPFIVVGYHVAVTILKLLRHRDR
jgi:hypothetical protein